MSTIPVLTTSRFISSFTDELDTNEVEKHFPIATPVTTKPPIFWEKTAFHSILLTVEIKILNRNVFGLSYRDFT